MTDNTTTAPGINIACFVTSHGFGHAARAAAVMNAINIRWPYVHFELFSEVPPWFFTESLQPSFTYHRLKTDVGLVQSSPLAVDLQRTSDALDDFLPFQEKQLIELSETITERGCMLVLCDISPLGIAVGQKAGISSIVVENFTWDWIYSSYQTSLPRFAPHCAVLADIFSAADHRIQTEPVCLPRHGAFTVPPIARAPRRSIAETRGNLGIAEGERMVLITMGGIPSQFRAFDKIAGLDTNVTFVIPGLSANLPREGKKIGRVVLLPHASRHYHPDLVRAADAVVGKIGYSTLAEVYHAGVPFGYITRSDFAESDILSDYVRKNMVGTPFPADEGHDPSWLDLVESLLSMPRMQPRSPHGAQMAADHICRLLTVEKELIEIVDTDGTVIGAAPRKRVHGNNRFIHRVVHVLVFDSTQRLLLQKRSHSKRVAPGKWDTSVGGHVDCGETLIEAAVREMMEEVGIGDRRLRFAYQYIHSNDFESELVSTYLCHHDGPVFHNPEEIDAVKFWDIEEIEAHLNTGLFSDNFEDEFRRYRSWAENPT